MLLEHYIAQIIIDRRLKGDTVDSYEPIVSLADRLSKELDMTCIVHGQVVDHAFGDCICTED